MAEGNTLRPRSSSLTSATLTSAAEMEGACQACVADLGQDSLMMPSSSSQNAVPNIFLQPFDCIKSVSDYVKAGEEKFCVASAIFSPSEIFLVHATHFPKKVDSFIWCMSDVYNSVIKGPHRNEWLVNYRLVRNGMFVAVYKREENEWHRGQVLYESSSNPERRMFMVQFIDFGDREEIWEGDLAYLHKNFAHQLGWSIRCRLELGKYYDRYHKGTLMWPPALKKNLHDTLFDKRFRVKFLRKVIQYGYEVWEVSLLNFRDAHPMNVVNQPIQKQVILRMLEKYVEDDGTEITEF
ncbi:unnamed protein product [Orchesella dallaii]|uniref:Tudor domain-containing protein n=1 Tax=Orchesella dallaii TaxID=48710 RepID=A0ABP1QIY8_9HEXA